MNQFKTMKGNILKHNSGQAILIVSLAISFTLIGTLVIAGYLTRLQIQQAAGISKSAESLYGANSGVECAHYYYNQWISSADFPSDTTQLENNINKYCNDSPDTDSIPYIADDTSTTNEGVALSNGVVFRTRIAKEQAPCNSAYSLPDGTSITYCDIKQYLGQGQTTDAFRSICYFKGSEYRCF